jgi:hypothetical protein
MRTGVFGGKQTTDLRSTQPPRRERLDTASLPHTTPTKLTGRTYIRRNIPVLGKAHSVFVDDTTGKLEIVASQQLAIDGSYEIKLAENTLSAFAGILIELPGHGFAFLDRDTCKQPDVDIQLVFTDIPDFKSSDGKLALLIDDIFPLDITPLIAKWTPLLQQRLGGIPGTSFLRTTADNKGCFMLNGMNPGKQLKVVKGEATDKNGKPIVANIGVWIGERSSGPAHLMTRSGKDGKFEFQVDADANISVCVWDPQAHLISELTYLSDGILKLVAVPAGLADVLVSEGGSGEPVQGLVFDAERQTDNGNGNSNPDAQVVFAGPRMTDPSGHARILLPAGTYTLVVRDSTTKGGTRWEIPSHQVSLKAAGPAVRVQLRATRMRVRNLVPAHGLEPR